MEYPVKGLVSLCDITPSGTYSIKVPSDLDFYIAKALSSMLPAIKAELSAPNFIFELKDIKHFRRTVDSFFAFKDRILARKGTFRPWTPEETLKHYLRQASNIALTQSFMLAPLLADVQAAHRALRNVRDQINKILVEEGKLLKRHFSCPLQGYGGNSELTAIGTASNRATFRLGRNTLYWDPRFRATVTYSYRLAQYEREHAVLLGFLDAFGVNWRPSIVWNAIPFSFVVDWFTNIGKWLDNFQLNNIEPYNEIYSFVWSITIKREIQLTLQTNFSPQPNVMPTALPTHTILEDCYKRVSEDRVNMYRRLETSGLSLKELGLALALKFS